MKARFYKTICLAIASLLVIQPAMLSAHDFGGTSVPGSTPAGTQGQDTRKNQTVGGQISLFDGSEVFTEADLATKGHFPIVFARTYDSRSLYDSPVGYGWSHVYDIRLFTYSDGSAVIRWGSGAKSRFVQTGGGYVSDENAPGEFRDNGNGTFSFLGPRGVRFEFDILGNLVQIMDNSGNYLQLSYTPDKKPLTGKSPFSVAPDQPRVVSYSHQLLSIAEGTSGGLTGRVIQLTYDPGTGRLNSISDASGRSVTYQHDDSGNLTRISLPENLFYSYLYNDASDVHNLTSFLYGYVDGGSDVTSTLYENVYDAEDRVIEQTYAGGSLLIAYTTPMVKTTVTRIVRDGVGTVLHNFQNVYEYNDDGYLVRFTDEEGNLVEYLRDANNNVARKVLWKNNGTVGAPDRAVFQTVQHQYDGANNMTQQVITLGDGETLTWQYIYDHGWLSSSTLSSNRFPGKFQKLAQEFNYNADGFPRNIKSQRMVTNASGTTHMRKVSYSYNTTGQLTAVDHENGDRKEYQYTNGLLTGMEGFSFIWSSDGRDDLEELRRPDGLTRTINYDDLGRPVTIQNTLNEQTILTYEGWNLTQVEVGKKAALPGYMLTNEYDETGRIVSQSEKLSGAPYATIRYTYDSNDNMLSVTNALSQTTTYRYSPKNRLTRVTAPSNGYITYDYDLVGNVISVADSVNTTGFQYTYDGLNRIRNVTDALGNTVSYKYLFNNISSITDPQGHMRTFDYNMAGRLTEEKTPTNKATQYIYDSKGRLHQQLDANGVTTELTYTRDDRIAGITVQTAPAHTVSYLYDDYGNLISYTDNAISTTPVMTYTYDALNRLDTATNTIINKTLDYDYDRFGLLSGLTLKETGGADYFNTVYNHDPAGRLTTMTESPGRVSSFTYDDTGRISAVTYPQGSRSAITYKNTGLLESLTFKKADDSTIDFFVYNYDDVGTLESIADSIGTATYTFDNLSQVTGVTYPAGSALANETYTYDASGNRLTSATVAGWSYNLDNQLTGFGSTSFSYDNNGNTLTQTAPGASRTFAYDGLNRLTDMAVAGSNLTFSYDHLGRRIKKVVNGATTWFMYDGYRLIAEFDGTGSLIRHYGYLPGSYAPHSLTDSTGYYSIMADHTGTPRRIINGAEQVVWKGDCQSFGQMVFDEDPDGNGNTLTMNLRFAGQYYDQETGLYCNSNRFYNPETGRFLSIDPVRGNLFDGGELNDYTYCMNNPMSYFDPSGMKRKRPHWLAQRFWGSLYQQYYRMRHDAYTYYYFAEEIFTRPVQNVKDAVTGKMGTGIQVFTVTAGTFGTITLLAFGGAWLAVQGGPALVFAKYSGTILSWMSLVMGVPLQQLMNNPQLIPAVTAASQVKGNHKDATTIVQTLADPPTDLPGGIDAVKNLVESSPGAIKYVGNTYNTVRRAINEDARNRRISPYEREQHPVTIRFLHR